jgi:hypothetical protein
MTDGHIDDGQHILDMNVDLTYNAKVILLWYLFNLHAALSYDHSPWPFVPSPPDLSTIRLAVWPA